MSVMRTHAPDVSGESAPPRVREQARDALTLMAFSLAVSFACCLLLLASHVVGR
ncbi:MAG: hypothetical protein NTX33_14870 [Propionibacteriales bacterium]|nr:hypothetical protein [Propionibacteriales bacterium]